MNFREKLAALFPENSHKLLFYAKGSKHPPYNELGIAETLAAFCVDFLPLCPLADPRGKRIKVEKANFPKLADLEHKTLTRKQFNATQICACIEDGTFNADHYKPQDKDRMRDLFWLPDLIRDPDAIYRNAHKIVAGDEIYVKVYDKMGSNVKLAFTMDIHNGSKLIRTVIVTSFLTSPATAISYVRGEPLYRRK